MDERLKILLVSAIISTSVFLSGVLLGAMISKSPSPDIPKIMSQFSERVLCENAFSEMESREKVLAIFRKHLPYRLENGNFDESVLRMYMNAEYEYYTWYIHHWKRCGFRVPILYFFNIDEKSVNCGKKLDTLQNVYVFAFTDVNSEVTKLIRNYYRIDKAPAIVICEKYRLPCDRVSVDEIKKYLEKC